MASKPKRVRRKDYITDRPILSGQDDLLNRRPFADALARLIRDRRSCESLAIGVCGEWGCGKTSLKNLVLEGLQKSKSRKVDILQFAPWAISGQGHVTTLFFRELAIALAPSSTVIADTTRKYSGLLSKVGVGLKAAGRYCVSQGEGVGVIFEVVGAAVDQTAQLGNQAANAADPKTKIKEQSLADVRESLTKQMMTLKRPILVVIDDIDRLTSDEVREVFRLVKENANFPNIVYLLMFDRSMVSLALDELSGGRGNEYLEKIVQVLFHVPKPSSNAVHRVLFDGLDEFILREGAKERWNSWHWNNIWSGGLDAYFSNLRDVYRFLGSFDFLAAQFSNTGVLEVNPIDLVAIEVLRLFEPLLYEAIIDHRNLLTDTPEIAYSRDKDSDDPRSSELERLLMLVSEVRRDRARVLLCHLFPVLSGSVSRGYDSLSRNLSVAHPDFFDRYFTLYLAADDVSQSDIDTLLMQLGNPSAFAAACSSLGSGEKLEVAFLRMDAYRNSFPVSVFPRAITSLIDVGDSFPRKVNPKWSGAKLETLVYAWRLIYYGLERVPDEQKRFAYLKDGMAASRGVRLCEKIIRLGERVGKRPEDYFLISAEHQEVLKGLALQRIREAAIDGRLREMPNLKRLLLSWSDWGTLKEVREWCLQNVKSDSGALSLLRTFLIRARVTAPGKVSVIWSVDLETMAKFSILESIEEWTHKLNVDELESMDRRALQAFRTATKCRNEGQTQDCIVDHMEENQLPEDL